MEAASRPDGDRLMTTLPKREIPDDVLEGSIIARVAAAYFSVGKRLERKTQCSATRGFILSTLRDGAARNPNQIATMLGLDRTVVHRAIKTMVQEGLVAERKAPSGRAIPVKLTAKGNQYRERLIQARKAADDFIRRQMAAEEREALLRLLKVVAECEF